MSSGGHRQQKGDRPAALVDTTMIWIALCLPLMILGVVIAILPLVWAMAHERRWGSNEVPRVEMAEPVTAVPVENANAELAVCAVCSSVVHDVDAHFRAVHRLAA